MSRTIAQAVTAATQRLRAAGVDDPGRDARRLVAHAAGLAPDRLTLHMPDPFDASDALEKHLIAREARQPVSQIVGVRHFFGRDFRVTPDVLDPRPETETLVAAALEKPFFHVLDLGSGTGCILLTLLAEMKGSRGLGVDVSEAALAVARGNAAALGLPAEFVTSDWFGNVTGTYDLIVSNPPYIAAEEMDQLAPELRNWEPRLALTDESDGLSAYRSIASGVAAHLVPAGRVLVEIGPTQADAVSELFREAGLGDVQVIPDLDGRDRVVTGVARTASL